MMMMSFLNLYMYRLTLAFHVPGPIPIHSLSLSYKKILLYKKIEIYCLAFLSICIIVYIHVLAI